MGTSNFYNKNANKVFAVLMNYETPILNEDGEETEETETVSPEEWEYEDLKKEVILSLEKSKFNHYTSSKTVYEDGLRSYPGTLLGDLYISKQYGDTEITVEITAIIRSGYYEGCNLDWECVIKIDGSETDSGEFSVDFGYASDMSIGLQAIVAPKALKWAEKMQNELIEELEKIYTEISMPLVVTARFSNGETWYAKAN